MATRKNATTQATSKKTNDLTYTIDRTFTTDDGTILFDATVNDIKLYGMRIIAGEKGDYISFPARKFAKDGKYYKYFYIEMNDEQTDSFIQAVFDKADA
ncbi:MAG: hypothetical protein IKV80_07120 [Bacteroidales bacterium]|nr:hypothetical protein [Bacteroidales bacterium]